MSIRRRLTLLTAAAVAVAVAVVAVAAYLLTRSELRDQVDESLLERAGVASGFVDGQAFGPGRGLRPPAPGFPPGAERRPGPGSQLRLPEAVGGPEVLAQIVSADGEVLLSRGLDEGSLPTAPAEEALRDGSLAPSLSDAQVRGVDLRVLTVVLDAERALQLARSLEEVNDTLARLGLIMLLVAIGGIGAAAGLGLLVARAALVPVRTLSATTAEVAATEDLTRRIEVDGEDEIARLGTSFNAMMAALERSVGAQKQLVADASHELRTPLTSLRTNIETLARRPEMPEADRLRLLGDLESEVEELARLVDDIVDLAREGSAEQLSEPVDIRLDEIVRDRVEHARRRTEEVTIGVELEPTLLRGRPDRLDRAVANLLDNALKWTPPGGRIDVSLLDGALTIADSGPGIDEVDLPHVFDRFYRSARARGTPGSGLGLAIAKQVVEAHGGTIEAGSATLGGTRVELRFPAGEVPPGDHPGERAER